MRGNDPMSPNMVLNVSETDQGMGSMMNVIGYFGQQDPVYPFFPRHSAKEDDIDIYDKNRKFADEKVVVKMRSIIFQNQNE